MDKYEYRIKTEQMLEYMKNKSYEKAMEIADSIDWRKVKNAGMLCAASEVYEYNGECQKSREILFVAYDRAPESRKIVYRLATLALKLGDTKEATDCYEEFVAMAPKDPNQYILRYKILKSQKAPVEQRIEALEDFKKAEYVEKWAYELANLYHEAGMVAECLEECDDLILWFSEGKYVYAAMELKMKYKPLTPLQQEKYIHRYDPKPEPQPEPIPVEEAVEEEAQPIPVEEAVEEEAQPIPVEETVEEEAQPIPVEEAVEEEAQPIPAEEAVEEPILVEEIAEEETAEEKTSAITQTVTGATLAEALAAGVAVATQGATVGEVMDAAKNMPVEAQKEEKKPEVEKTQGMPSIEEILQGWEEQQKENAQLILEEQKKAELERAERELERKEIEEEDSILPDDIRKLMEELEAEASEIHAQKVQTDAIQEERTAAMVKEAPVQELPEVKLPEVKLPEEELPEIAMPEEEYFEEDNFEEQPTDGFEEIEEIETPGESEDIKLGDTQAIAISAKALMNDTVVEVPEETQKKSGPTSPFDTGFIVQGRYDLEAQSEIGLKAGLTEEQKKLFSYFVPVHGMSEQIVDVLNNDKKCRTRYGTSRTANLLIVGRKGSGKTVLAVDIVKAIQKARKLKQGRVGIVTAESLNKKDVSSIVEKLHGGAIIIEKASKLSKKTIAELNELMEEQTGEMLVVLEEERRALDKMLAAHPAFKKKFTSRVELPVFINDELVTFGQTYAKENGFKIDEMGILALYSRIDLMQRESSVVAVADVKEIIDEAIEKSQKASLKSLVKKFFGKNKDESARIILTEQHFK